jgi:hypothetical protein
MHCYHQSTGKRQTFSRTNLGTVPSSHDVSYILANRAAPLLSHVHICFLVLRLPHFGCLGSWRGKCERANKQKEAGAIARSKPTARCIMWNPSMLRHKPRHSRQVNDVGTDEIPQKIQQECPLHICCVNVVCIASRLPHLVRLILMSAGFSWQASKGNLSTLAWVRGKLSRPWWIRRHTILSSILLSRHDRFQKLRLCQYLPVLILGIDRMCSTKWRRDV